MSRIACIQNLAPAKDNSRPLTRYTKEFAIFGRNAFSRAGEEAVYVESHGRLELYGGAKGWAETLAAFASGLGLSVSISVGFEPDRLLQLGRAQVEPVVFANKREEREALLKLSLRQTEEAANAELDLGPLFNRLSA